MTSVPSPTLPPAPCILRPARPCTTFEPKKTVPMVHGTRDQRRRPGPRRNMPTDNLNLSHTPQPYQPHRPPPRACQASRVKTPKNKYWVH
jgi:hypothetical protein